VRLNLLISLATDIPEKIPDLVSEFRRTLLAAAQRIRNLFFNGVRAKALREKQIKIEWKTQKSPQELTADEKGRPIQAVSHCCGTSPTESNTTTEGDPLENPSGHMPSGTSLDLRRALH